MSAAPAAPTAPTKPGAGVRVFFRPKAVPTAKPAAPPGWKDSESVKTQSLRFIMDNGYTKPSDRCKTASHNSYGGGATGVVYVPLGAPTEEFAAAIVADFRARRFTCFAEVVPGGDKPMRLYFDFDLADASPLDEDMWSEMEHILLEELRKFYKDTADTTFTALVLSSGMRAGPEGHKAGVHVVFENLYVTVDQALYISSAVIARAERRWPAADGVWRKRIDQAVYGKGRGLRWAWQFKATPCHKCCLVDDTGRRTASAKGCPECVRGKVPDTDASMYSPLYRLCHNGCRHPFPDAVRLDPSVELLLLASVRGDALCVAPTPGFLVYEGAPPKPALVSGRAKDDTRVVMEGDAEVKRAVGGGAKASVVPEGTAAFRAVQSAIRRSHAAYADLDLRLLTQFASGKGFKAIVKGHGARFCQNVGRDHKQATIKFVVSKKGLRQECHCKCSPTDGTMPCRTFQSDVHPLLHSEARLLFPDDAGASGDVEADPMFMAMGGGSGGGSGDGGPGSQSWYRQLHSARKGEDAYGAATAALLQERLKRIPAPAAIAGLSEEQRLRRVTEARAAAAAAASKAALLKRVRL